jgi:uncharacterized RmlC-like cupin family protein
MTTECPPICIVSPSEFDPGTTQTSGSIRLAAIAPQLFVQSAMWGGLFKVEPGARTGIHHHGEQQTVAYVLSGICDVRWGAKGEYNPTRLCRRFHSCACLSAAHGDQSIGDRAF